MLESINMESQQSAPEYDDITPNTKKDMRDMKKASDGISWSLNLENQSLADLEKDKGIVIKKSFDFKDKKIHAETPNFKSDN